MGLTYRERSEIWTSMILLVTTQVIFITIWIMVMVVAVNLILPSTFRLISCLIKNDILCFVRSKHILIANGNEVSRLPTSQGLLSPREFTKNRMICPNSNVGIRNTASRCVGHMGQAFSTSSEIPISWNYYSHLMKICTAVCSCLQNLGCWSDCLLKTRKNQYKNTWNSYRIYSRLNFARSKYTKQSKLHRWPTVSTN